MSNTKYQNSQKVKKTSCRSPWSETARTWSDTPMNLDKSAVWAPFLAVSRFFQERHSGLKNLQDCDIYATRWKKPHYEATSASWSVGGLVDGIIQVEDGKKRASEHFSCRVSENALKWRHKFFLEKSRLSGLLYRSAKKRDTDENPWYTREKCCSVSSVS